MPCGIQRRRCRGIRRKEVPGVLRQLQEDGEAPANPRRRAGRDARGFALRRNGPNREQRPAAGQERRDGSRRRVPEGVGRSQRLGVRGFQRPDGRNRPARAGRTTFVLAVDGRPHPPGQRRAHGDGLPLPQGTGLCRQGGGRRADRRGEREGSQGRQLRNHRPAQERPRNLVRLPGRSPALPARHPDARDGIQAQPGRGHEAGSLHRGDEPRNADRQGAERRLHALHRRRADRHLERQTTGRRHQPRRAADAAVPAGDGGDAPERIPLGNRTQLPRLRLGAVRFLPEQGAARRQRRTCRARARRGKRKEHLAPDPPRKLRQAHAPACPRGTRAADGTARGNHLRDQQAADAQGRTAPELIRAGCKQVKGRPMRPPLVLSGYSHLRAAPGSPKPSRPHIPARRPAAMPVPAPETTPGNRP